MNVDPRPWIGWTVNALTGAVNIMEIVLSENIQVSQHFKDAIEGIRQRVNKIADGLPQKPNG